MRLTTSKAFDREFEVLSVPLRTRVYLTVWDLLRRYERKVPLETRRVRKVEGLRSNVWRVKLADKPRLLYHWNGEDLLLLSVGDHKVTERYTDAQFQRDLKTARVSETAYSLANAQPSIFGSDPDEVLDLLTNEELVSDWIYYLDDEQLAIARKLEAAAKYQISNKRSTCHFIIGGPGTGKTSLLLNLLDRARLFGGMEVRLRAQPQVRRYAQTAFSYDLNEYNLTDDGGARPRLVLVDDPDVYDDITRAAEAATLAQRQMLVIAFDPLQLASSLSDAQYRALRHRYSVVEHRLSTAYRQKANVGKAAKKVIESVAKSTPFLDDGKIERFHKEHSQLTTFSNEVSFPNPRGYVEFYPAADERDVDREFGRLMDNASLMWAHWSPLLVVIDEAIGSRDRKWITDKIFLHWPLDLPRPVVTTLDHVRDIKGAEFQHAFLFLAPRTHREIEYGFRGSGQLTYNRRRLLRIPFSRAKDSMCTFVLADD